MYNNFKVIKMKELKVIFMGTPDFAVPVLQKLIEETNVVLVVTQPDKLVGRKQILTKTPVKLEAENHNIPVFQSSHHRYTYLYESLRLWVV